MSRSLPKPQTQEFLEQMQAIAAENRSELESSRQSLEEIRMLISQNNAEVERLTQREMQVANRVREMEANLEAYDRGSIRDLLRAAHEVELRLFVMRGQVDQLKEREETIRDFQSRLRLLVEISEGQIAADEERRQVDEGRTRILRRKNETSNQPAVPLEDVIMAQENERLRISRKVADGPAQTLANIILSAEVCERLLERSPEDCLGELESLRAMANRSLQSARRMMYELRPVTLGELGVIATLRRYANEICRPLNVRLQLIGPDSDDNIPEPIRISLYRFLQEIMSAGASVTGVEEMRVDVRYEEAQVVARVDISGSALSDLSEVKNLESDPELALRLEQLTADLQVDAASATTARISLNIPLT